MIKKFNEDFEENSFEYIEDKVYSGLETIKNIFIDFIDSNSIQINTFKGSIDLKNIESTSRLITYSLEEEFPLIGTLLVKCVIDLDYKEEAIGLSINELEELLTCIKRLNHSGYQSYLCFIDKIDHQEAVVRIFVKVRKNSTNKIFK